ncbi:MAG: AAA family ATPase [Candidatus Binatia bacterium]
MSNLIISPELRQEFSTLLNTHVPGLEIKGDQATGRVPWREDNHPSFAADLEKGVWYDKARKEGGGIKAFKERLGLNRAGQQPSCKIVATYDYTDESGTLLYQVVRYESKQFKQRRPDGKGGWFWNLNGTRRVLYALSELKGAETVFIDEGEKDTNRLWSMGLVATTCPQGAGQWREEYNQYLAGKHVVILPDNDEPGEQHALQVARSLLPVAASVRLVRLPGLPSKGDVSDWLDAGRTKEELLEIVHAAPPMRLEDLPTAPQARQNRLTLTRLGDLLNEPEETVSWLVDGLLPAGGFSLLVAKPKAGKSTLARNLALAVAQQGRDFFSRTVQYGPVVYLALEEKRAEVRKHFRDMGATGAEDIYIFAASAPTDALQQIRAVAEEKKPALIIIDPLFKLTRVKDSNDYAQVTAALEPLLVLARETGAHVLCVHHAGKGDREGGDAILGSTAIFAAVDTALIMKRSERYRTLSSQQRYGEDLLETVLRFDPTTRMVALGETKEREDTSKMKDTLVAFLKTQEEPLSERDIKDAVEGNNRHKQTALRELVSGQAVERLSKGSKGDPYLYRFSLVHSSLYQKYESENPKEGVSPRADKHYAHFDTPGFFPDVQETQKSASEHWEDDL